MANNHSELEKRLWDSADDLRANSKLRSTPSSDFWRNRFIYIVAVLATTLAWIASTFVILTTVEATRRFYCSMPYGDMWWFVGDMANFRSHRIGLGFLWQQHAEHRIVLPRLIFWIDLYFFHFRGIFTIICGFLFQILEGLLLCFALWRVKSIDVISKLVYAALVFCMMFSASQIEAFILPFQVQFPLAFFMASLSIFLVLRYCETQGGSPLLLLLGIVAAIFATLSLGCGLLIWPVLLLICFSKRAPLSSLFTTAIAGAGIWICYFIGYYSPDESANPWVSLTHPVLVVRFAFAFLTSVVSSRPSGFANLLIVTLLFIAILSLVFHVRAHSTSFQTIPPLMAYLALFIVATAFLTALCRLNFGLYEASAIRYRLPSLIFWSCILGLLAAVWNGTTNYVVRISVFPIVGLLFISIVLVPVQRPTIEYFAGLSSHIKNDAIALSLDVSDKVYEDLFKIRPDLVRSYTPFLREYHLSVFADPLYSARGKALTGFFGGISSGDCLGSFEGMKPLRDTATREGSAFGWGWLQVEGREPVSVVLADEAKTVVGLAHGLETRPDVEASFHNSKMLTTGWSGYYHAEPTSRIITAYAILPDGKTLCSLGQLEIGH